jgi:hypothetical protein
MNVNYRISIVLNVLKFGENIKCIPRCCFVVEIYRLSSVVHSRYMRKVAHMKFKVSTALFRWVAGFKLPTCETF